MATTSTVLSFSRSWGIKEEKGRRKGQEGDKVMVGAVMVVEVAVILVMVVLAVAEAEEVQEEIYLYRKFKRHSRETNQGAVNLPCIHGRKIVQGTVKGIGGIFESRDMARKLLSISP